MDHTLTLERAQLPPAMKEPMFYFDENRFVAVMDGKSGDGGCADVLLLEDIFQRKLFMNEVDNVLCVNKNTRTSEVWCLCTKKR